MGDRAFAAAVRQHLDGDLGAAIGGYRRVLASDPNHADALNNLGGALMRHERGSAAEAEQALARAVRLRPTYADAYVNLGVCRRERGALRGALTAFASAAALNPDAAAAYERMGAAVRASHAAGSTSQARALLPLGLRALAVACALSPTDPALWSIRGEVALAIAGATPAGEGEESSYFLPPPSSGTVGAAMAAHPTPPAGLEALAPLKPPTATAALVEAVDSFGRALETAPDDRGGHARYANAAFALGVRGEHARRLPALLRAMEALQADAPLSSRDVGLTPPAEALVTADANALFANAQGDDCAVRALAIEPPRPPPSPPPSRPPSSPPQPPPTRGQLFAAFASIGAHASPRVSISFNVWLSDVGGDGGSIEAVGGLFDGMFAVPMR